MPDRPLVIVRADASSEIGLGHAMRSRTLALALVNQGCNVRMVGRGLELLPDDDRLVIEVREASTGDALDAALIVEASPDLAIVDGYHFDSEFFARLEHARVTYAVVDDNGETAARHPVAVLNQNPHAKPAMYDHMGTEPLLMLGLEFSLIRPEIVAARRAPGEARRSGVFVAMGGSDVAGLTGPITAAIVANGHPISAAVGRANPCRRATSEFVARRGRLVDDGEYPNVLATSVCAVLAAGTSLWEAEFLRTAAVAIVVADNQTQACESFDGPVVDARSIPADSAAELAAAEVDRLLRQATKEARPDRIDGQGPGRVARYLWEAASRGSR